MSKIKKVCGVIRDTIKRLVKTKRKDYTPEEYDRILKQVDAIPDDDLKGLVASFEGVDARGRNNLTCAFMLQHTSLKANCDVCEARLSCCK